MANDNDRTLPHPSSSDPDPTKIGRYAIKRRIASGGMGTIYEAVQEKPRRPVALKVMRAGLVSPAAIRRFEYESQILARLRHPGIAQVYEAGTYGKGDDALPYFAMEYVPNAKVLTQYARDKKLDTKERLDLFARICDAVHHGHQKGIVHRDLKPSNVLVDSHGNPRVIDFGVARATDSDVALATVQTEVGQLLGSVQYMSPEQFDADPHDLDTRSDVYALGVLLYELLCDEPPYDLTKTNVYEASRIVREDDPPSLSAVRSDLGGDVETIVRKAMEKDRDRRYQSAFGLAEDIRRYLNGDAIMARPPSMGYQLRVFARRNKGVIAAVTSVLVVLLAGVATSTALYVHAEKQRDRAEAQTVKAQVTSEFLKEMIQEAIPMGFGEEAATISDLLDLSRERAPKAFADEPEAEAQICRTLGWGYLTLTDVGEAYRNLARAYELRKSALGPRHPSTIESLHELARINLIAGETDSLVSISRQIRSISLDEKGPDDPATLGATYKLAVALANAGDLIDAEETAMALSKTCHRVFGEDGELTIYADIFRGGLLLMRGELAEAESLSQDLFAKSRHAFGDEHDVTRTARSQLAAALISRGKHDSAADLYGNRRMPEEMGIVHTYQGAFAAKQPGAQVIFFWESWCPFSQRAVPNLEDCYQQLRDYDVDVVGVTEVNRTATDETVHAFIDGRGVTFPVVKSDGKLNRYFRATTPFVLVLRDGVMIWENYLDIPDELPSSLVKGLIADGGN